MRVALMGYTRQMEGNFTRVTTLLLICTNAVYGNQGRQRVECEEESGSTGAGIDRILNSVVWSVLQVMCVVSCWTANTWIWLFYAVTREWKGLLYKSVLICWYNLIIIYFNNPLCVYSFYILYLFTYNIDFNKITLNDLTGALNWSLNIPPCPKWDGIIFRVWYVSSCLVKEINVSSEGVKM